jgi:hypothetical protein
MYSLVYQKSTRSREAQNCLWKTVPVYVIPETGGTFMVKRARFFIPPMIVVLLFFCSGKALSAPAVVADQTVYDAGLVTEGKEISHDFMLKNTGDQTLTFKIKPC